MQLNNDQEINDKDLVHFANDDSKIKFTAKEDGYGILLSGKPISEEVESYGPFVMNSQTEIMEAMRDAQMGKMGVLIRGILEHKKLIVKFSVVVLSPILMFRSYKYNWSYN